MYTNTRSDPHISREAAARGMLELFPGASPFSCCIVVQDRVDRGTSTRGATCFHFFLALLHLLMSPTVAPYIFCLRRLSKASPCFPGYVPRPLQYQPIRAASWVVFRRRKPTLLLCSASTFLLPHGAGDQPLTCPVSARVHHQGLGALKAMPKAIGWPIKWFGLDVEKDTFFFLSLFIGMLSIFNQVIEIVCNQKSIQPEKM